MSSAPSPAQRRGRRPARRRRRAVPWGYLLMASLLGAAVCYIGFRVLLDRYLHSEAFLGRINRATSRALRVDGAFEPFSWQNAQATSPGFRGVGVPGSPVGDLHAQGIEAHLNLRGIWDGVWEITELTIDRAELNLAAGEAGTRAIDVPVASQMPDADTPGGVLTSLLPKTTRIEKMLIESADITFPLPGDAAGATVKARRLRVHAKPLGGGLSNGYEFSGRGGEIHLPEGRRLSLVEFDARWRDGTLHISDAVADLKGSVGARLQCSGRLDTNRGESELDLRLSGIDVEEIVSPDWRRRITGHLAATFTLKTTAGVTARDGNLSVVGGVLHTLPILDHLADFTKHDTFRRLPLSKATAHFSQSGDTMVIDDILLESSGTLRVTGTLQVTDDIARGTLSVGVVPGVLRWIPGAEQKVFTRLDDGHLWTEMRVHGPLHALNEDLSSRLVTGAIAQTIEAAPERAVQTGAEVLRQGTSILREGVRGGIDLLNGFVPFFDN